MSQGPQQHRVQRLLIELSTARRVPLATLQPAVQRQLQLLLLPAIDRWCTALGDASQLQRIDRLVVQLGAWPPAAWSGDSRAAAALQADFEARLCEALGQALQAATPVVADAELVASCLHSGQLPWWADGSDRSALKRALAALLAQPVRPGLAWLPPADADAPALQRLVAALGDDQLADLAGRLQGTPASGLPWTPLLGSVAAALALVPGTLRRAWWAEALAAALQPGSAGWAQALQRLPDRLGMGVAVLAPAWRRALDRLAAQADPAALRPLWLALDTAWPAPAPSAAAALAPAAALVKLDALLQALLLAVQQPPQQEPAAPAAAHAPFDATSLPWAQALASGGPAAAGAAWQRQLAEALARPAVSPPSEALLAGLLQQGLASLPLPAGADPGQRPAAGRTLARRLSALSAQSAPPARQPGAPPAQPSSAVTPQPTLAAAEALYLANAGLVLLWPFLQRFAERLGLLDQRQFRSPAQAMRAAALLQCTVTGDADPPEFQLPLCKLLCGLPLEGPSWLDEALSADEQDECEALLVAVVAAAPVLREMSPAGFRSAFLQRNGQLSTQDGHWLLRVERQTHDVVMDRFPWSPALVRLPWMPRLLQVQW